MIEVEEVNQIIIENKGIPNMKGKDRGSKWGLWKVISNNLIVKEELSQVLILLQQAILPKNM